MMGSPIRQDIDQVDPQTLTSGDAQNRHRARSCPVCQEQNKWYATRCSHCGSYLQNKVDTLNLFETLWELVESPLRALSRIILAEHKNYTLLLSGVFGIAFVYAYSWFHHVGARIESLLVVLLVGLLAGPVAGIGLMGILSALLTVILRKLGSPMSFRNVHAVTSYASAPVVFSLFLVFPLELMTFGGFLFTSNPSLGTLNPASYVLFLLLDGSAVLWSVVLLSVGVHVLSGFRVLKSALIAVGSSALVIVPFLAVSV